jgi:hypothetical protein
MAFPGCCYQPTEADPPGITLFAFSLHESEPDLLAVVVLILLTHVGYEGFQVTGNKLLGH